MIMASFFGHFEIIKYYYDSVIERVRLIENTRIKEQWFD
jgi:hypothetical protein